MTLGDDVKEGDNGNGKHAAGFALPLLSEFAEVLASRHSDPIPNADVCASPIDVQSTDSVRNCSQKNKITIYTFSISLSHRQTDTLTHALHTLRYICDRPTGGCWNSSSPLGVWCTLHIALTRRRCCLGVPTDGQLLSIAALLRSTWKKHVVWFDGWRHWSRAACRCRVDFIDIVLLVAIAHDHTCFHINTRR